MLIFVARHANETGGYRGGHGNQGMDDTGVEQAMTLAQHLYSNQKQYII